ncbi:hypothetical protein NPIL_487521 [Nephila pilipes]|uniref:Uncharacterized protein n=1 Tax=Nephila pilipes TaxID=299642 RepID=A0A8X6TT34_NEPPI|nr:hypothetical protein NPIL_487521 [Nephila pilipes]
MKAALLFLMIVALIAMAMASVHHHHHRVRDNADHSQGSKYFYAYIFMLAIFLILISLLYGLQYGSGTWNGIIGLVQRKEAYMGVKSLPISENSWKILDFGMPYGVLVKAFGTKVPGEMIKVSSLTPPPFSSSIWILYDLTILTTTVLFQRIMPRKIIILISKNNATL